MNYGLRDRFPAGRDFTHPNDTFTLSLRAKRSNLYSYRSLAMLVLKSFVAIIDEDRSVMQNGRTGCTGATGESPKDDRQSRVRVGRSHPGCPSPPNRFLFRDCSREPLYLFSHIIRNIEDFCSLWLEMKRKLL